MAIQTKKVPPINAPADIMRAFQEIYEHLNELGAAVNEGSQAPPKEREGKTGDIRVVKSDKGDYHLQVKSSEGWVSTLEGTLKLVPKEDTQPKG